MKNGHKAIECRSAPNPANLVEQQPQPIQEVDIEVGGIWQVANVNRVATKNRFEPLKIEINPSKSIENEDDQEWPKIKQHPTNNRPGPKRVNLEKALQEPRKKRVWKRMIDQIRSEDPNEMLNRTRVDDERPNGMEKKKGHHQKHNRAK